MIWYFGWDEAILAGDVRVDLAELPAVADVSPARKPMLIKLLLALLWLAGSLILALPFFEAPMQIQAIVLMVPFSGLILIAMVLRGLLRRRRVCFEKDGVKVFDRRWWRRSEWSAPYTAFLGIGLRQQTIPMGLDNRVVYIAELAHANPRLSLPLLVSSEGPPSKRMLTAAARIFDTPLLDDDKATRVKQQIKRFNRPISEIARTFDLAAIYDPLEPVPRHVTVSTPPNAAEPTYEVTLLPRRLSPLWAGVLIAATLATLAVAAVTRNIAIALDSLAFSAFAAFILASSLQHARKLRLTRRDLVCEAAWWVPKARRSARVALDDIESVMIVGTQSGHANHMEIRHKDGAIELGSSLPYASLDWLRRFLISAIVTA